MQNQNEKALLLEILLQSPLIQKVLNSAPHLGTPNWYLGAGCIAQTVWNFYHEYNPTQHIKDCDLVYFDEDLSEEKEEMFIARGATLFADVPVAMDIVNQARVHVWYEKSFGYSIKPYTSIEHAISTWPTTATCVALTYTDPEEIRIYEPYGLTDLLNMTVRANKTQITQEIYEKKVARWIQAWPKLKIVPWKEL